MNDKKFACIGFLLSLLRAAYVAARKAVALANRLSRTGSTSGRVNHRARVLGRLNRIRSELRKFEKMGGSLFDCVAYSGVIINLIK